MQRRLDGPAPPSQQQSANFTMEFARYEQLPGSLAEELKAAPGEPVTT